ncbi:uncharacterized protein A4U43_C03F18150 [Asparagus officinalis]|uniref:C-CAP/cofactor C-like domain-containing protein n=1 Tax=Asparagus officinalis TaxID=4686 RepID=A0A5P1FB15_ASPOF|nr:tubulin-folding cofactor C [Asparagus officinalis]XP_020257433.1 tubulin-folding cofactor C [Asparagus officinalis]XP_020257434.1 tubulin-folding cofactor C [Asparagus officinalis]ONK75558.1 uncharacterized protein A4U43_C03F18150 [Asparagus officinalis]
MEDKNPTSETEPDAQTHKKHLAMLDRLANLHQTRSSTRNQSKPEPGSLSSFLSLFSSTKLSIESDLTRLLSSDSKPDPAVAKPDLDKISTSISDLERVLAQNSYFLPSYELRSSLKSISDLKGALEKASSELIPRKKFSFKNKSALRKDPAELFKQSEEKPQSDANLPTKEIKSSPGIRSKKGAVLVKNFRVLDEGNGEFTLSDLDSCEVYIKGRIRALFINRLTNCRVFCGPVLGSILIEEVRGCLFVLASHQIRIHQAKETDFYLRVRSRPIIEDCGGVRFGPYRFSYEGVDDELRESRLDEETGNWGNVDDFKWLRAVQSPNWCLIPEEEWVDTVNASELEENFDDC